VSAIYSVSKVAKFLHHRYNSIKEIDNSYRSMKNIDRIKLYEIIYFIDIHLRKGGTVYNTSILEKHLDNVINKVTRFIENINKSYCLMEAALKKELQIFNFLDIYLSKGASCNPAGDGPKTQWDLFVDSGIIMSTDIQHVLVGMYNQGGGDCFYYSILQLRDLSSWNIFTVSDLRLSIWYYITNHQNQLCKEIYDAFRAADDNDTYEEFIEGIKRPNHWACSKTIIITSMFLQTDIIIITNEINSAGTMFTGLFKTSTALKDQLNIDHYMILPNEKKYIYISIYIINHYNPHYFSNWTIFVHCEEDPGNPVTLLSHLMKINRKQHVLSIMAL